MYLLLKAALSGLIVAAASELARRWSLVGAVLVSLPLTSILAFVWLHRDTGSADEVSALSWSILFVLAPSAVLFVVLPLALRSGLAFWPALLVACAATAGAYGLWLGVARAVGFQP